MSDQVRHDGFGTFYETINFGSEIMGSGQDPGNSSKKQKKILLAKF